MDGEKKLTAKQEKFCMEYIVDYNGTQAAIRAGYSESSARTTAWRMLKNDDIAARVRELQREYNDQRCFYEKDRCMGEFWKTYEKAVEAGDGKTAAKCLELIGKTNGMFTEKVAVGADAESSGEVHFSIEVKKTGD
ncbi:MAG: terminase small subunit [Oscillospiraceae bacterium]|nr:terminase small subunit [Oscillospiraceae bacterium]